MTVSGNSGVLPDSYFRMGEIILAVDWEINFIRHPLSGGGYRRRRGDGRHVQTLLETTVVTEYTDHWRCFFGE